MKSSPHVLMLFLDGVGIGRNDPRSNPFFVARIQTLRRCCGNSMIHLEDPYRHSPGVSLVPLDATLGIEGLPQSGTGQTALLTGINAPRLIGKHFGPYPFSSLKEILHRKNIFQKVKQMGKRPYFANAFPHQYFQYLENHRSRVTATTQAWLSTGLTLNDHMVLQRGEGVSSDITNQRWHMLGYPEIPVISAHEAGQRLNALSREYDFVLYEYYFTDDAGHHRSVTEAIGALEGIDELLDGILSVFDPTTQTLVLTSDHGNVEDLSTRSHTRNPIPFFVTGVGHHKLTENMRMLSDVTPVLLEFMI